MNSEWIPLFKLWQKSEKNGRLPNVKEIDEALMQIARLEKDLVDLRKSQVANDAANASLTSLK